MFKKILPLAMLVMLAACSCPTSEAPPAKGEQCQCECCEKGKMKKGDQCDKKHKKEKHAH